MGGIWVIEYGRETVYALTPPRQARFVDVGDDHHEARRLPLATRHVPIGLGVSRSLTHAGLVPHLPRRVHRAGVPSPGGEPEREDVFALYTKHLKSYQLPIR